MTESIDYISLVLKEYDDFVATLADGEVPALSRDEVKNLAVLLWTNKFDESPREFEKAVQELIAAKASI